MKQMDLLISLDEVKVDFVIGAEDFRQGKANTKVKNLSSKWIWLIAAIVALTLLLVGCVTYFNSLKDLVVIDHTIDIIAETEAYSPEEGMGETSQPTAPVSTSPIVAEQVLSLQGYEGSPSYNALQEWLAYVNDYIHQNPEVRFSDDFQRPDAYTKYTCFTQEMVDKVDELCEKYGLHLLGKSTFIVGEAGMAENGLSGVLYETVSPRCLYGHLYQDGSFVASGELEISDGYQKTVQFQMNNIKKDAFYTTHLGLNNIEDYIQWNYVTLDGYNALLALNNRMGLIVVENETRFISIIVDEVPDADMVFTGLPKEKQFLERVCDCFVFSDITMD